MWLQLIVTIYIVYWTSVLRLLALRGLRILRARNQAFSPRYQGCRGSGDSHGDSHSHGMGMGMGMKFSSVGIPIGILWESPWEFSWNPVGIPIGIPIVHYHRISMRIPVGIPIGITIGWGFPQDSMIIPMGIAMGIPTGFLWEWDGNGNWNSIPTATLLGTQVSGENTSDIRTLRIYFSFIRVFGYGESIGTIFEVPGLRLSSLGAI